MYVTELLILLICRWIPVLLLSTSAFMLLFNVLVRNAEVVEFVANMDVLIVLRDEPVRFDSVYKSL